MLSFSQSSPSYDIVCPGDTLVFTCITSYEEGIYVVWRINRKNSYLVNHPKLFRGFTLKITDINDATSTLTSTATRESVPLNLHGTVIDCSGNGVSYSILTVHISGKVYIMNHMYHNTVSMYRCTSIS